MLSYWLGLIPAAWYLGVINGSFRGGRSVKREEINISMVK